MEPEFVTVVVTATGRKQRVPAHYLTNPVLSRGIKLPPSAQKGDVDAPSVSEPSDAWTRPQLDERATALGLNAAEFRTKADVLAAITEATPPTPGEDETPATGDDEGAQ